MNIKRRFNNDQTVDQSLGKPSIFARDPSASSPDLGLIPFGSGPDINYREIFEQNIQLINHRISQLHKELSYWDLYKMYLVYLFHFASVVRKKCSAQM